MLSGCGATTGALAVERCVGEMLGQYTALACLEHSEERPGAVTDQEWLPTLERYLNHPRLRLTDIADMLGYASLGAFTHWHIQTFGMTPSQARKQARSKRTRVA